MAFLSLIVKKRPTLRLVELYHISTNSSIVLWKNTKSLLFKVEFSLNNGICPILARNTIGFLMGFRATTNHAGEKGDKKQNTLPYTLQVKVVEVCLIGAGDESVFFLWKNTAFAIINCSANFAKNDYQPFFIRKIPPWSSTLLYYLCQNKSRSPYASCFYFGAGDESRTRREQLGKLPPYR